MRVQYPYLILINSLVPALLAGNTLLLKPSPQTPTIAEHIVSIFLEAGLPENVLQTVHCGNTATLEALIREPGVRSIAFTGSVASGIAVQQAAASRTVPVGLELGGKDPAYIRPDVDVSWAAEEIVDGAVFNSGQSCCSVERVYVHEKIYDEFLEKLVSVLNGYKLGDPFDKTTNIGPVVSTKSARAIAEQVKDAEDKGARNLTPDVFSAGSKLGETFVRPEILADCSHKMRVMMEETFGPIIPVMKVSGDGEAVSLMNDSEFGLTASIWTKDVETGQRLAEQVEAGTVFVNRCDYPSPVSSRPLSVLVFVFLDIALFFSPARPRSPPPELDCKEKHVVYLVLFLSRLSLSYLRQPLEKSETRPSFGFGIDVGFCFLFQIKWRPRPRAGEYAR